MGRGGRGRGRGAAPAPKRCGPKKNPAAATELPAQAPEAAAEEPPEAPALVGTGSVRAHTFVSTNPMVDAALSRIAAGVEQALEVYAMDHAVVACYETVSALARGEAALYREEKLPPDTVGVNEHNRGGAGLVLAKCFEVAKKAIKSGYSYPKACEGAVASASPREKELLERALKVNAEQIVQQPDLPPLSCLNATTLGNGHSNGWLRLCKGRAPCAVPELAPTGRLDPDALCVGRPGLREALTGIHWQIYDNDLFERWPVLYDVYINALNNRCEQEISEQEGALLMAHKRDELQRLGKFDKVECIETALVSQPFWSPWSSSILDLVLKTPTDALEFVSVALKAVAPATESETINHFGYEFLSKLSGITFKGAKCCIRVRMALYLAQALSPSTAMDSSRYALILPSDVGGVTNKKNYDNAIAAEAVLDTAREICDKHGVRESSRGCVLGRFDNRVALWLVRRGGKSREAKTYSSLYEICMAFLSELSNEVGKTIEWGDWESLKPETDDGGGATAPQVPVQISDGIELQTASNMKDPVNILKSRGFSVSGHVKEKTLLKRRTATTPTRTTSFGLSNLWTPLASSSSTWKTRTHHVSSVSTTSSIPSEPPNTKHESRWIGAARLQVSHRIGRWIS